MRMIWFIFNVLDSIDAAALLPVSSKSEFGNS